MAWLPVLPQLILNFKTSKILRFFIKDSSDILQATATDGKFPHLFLPWNLEEPSRLIVAVSKYLSLN